jgi:hypothetical protein
LAPLEAEVAEVAEPLALQPAEERVEAAAEAAVPRAEVAAAAAHVVAAVAEAVVPRAEVVAEVPALPGRQAAARPSAVPSAFHPGRLRPAPAPRRAARSQHAMERSQIAPPTARWWQAARGEVWS